MPRTRMTLNFGEGLDRTTGPLLVEAARQADQRNVLLFDGRARVRPGSILASTLPLAVGGIAITDVLNVFPYRAGGRLLIVGAAIDAGKWNVYLYQADSAGTNPAYIGELWHALVPAARPVVSIAETYRMVFFAHAYHPYWTVPGTPLRGVTRIYDGAVTIIDYPATDLGGGLESPRFAGVLNYLAYLVGWGYGNKDTPDRADLVRFSKPAEPKTLGKNDYGIAGQPAQPVIACRPAGNSLLVLKEVEAFEIFGFDARTFGVRPCDTVFGCIGPHLAVSVGGICYSWTHQGPRAFGGQGPSGDISLPLGLAEPPPSDLLPPGDPLYAHAVYDPDTRRVLWYWPNPAPPPPFTPGTVVVALNLWNPTRPAWSFDTVDALINGACALALSTVPPPNGAPSITAVSPGELSADVDVLNTGNDGDEGLEVWQRRTVPPGPWAKVQTVPAVKGATQTVRLLSLLAATDYEVAVRYEKGGQFNAGALSANPSDWPATQRAAFLTAPATIVPVPPIHATSRCHDAALGLFGLIWAGVPPGASAQIALHYAGNSATTTIPPAPPTPDPSAVIYDVDPAAPCTRSTAWYQGFVGAASVYHAYVRATGSGVGPWGMPYTFWVLPGSPPRFFDATGEVAVGGACPLFGPPSLALRGARAATPLFAASPGRLFHAMGASAEVRRQSAEEFLDDGATYLARLQTNRYAPGGAGGEAVFQTLYLALAANAAAEVRITPIVDDRLLPMITVSVMPDGTGEMKVTRHLIVLTEDFSNGGGPVVFKYRPRGAWFAARLEVRQFSVGAVSLDSFDLELEPVRDSAGAEGVP